MNGNTASHDTDIKGTISVKLANNQSLDDLCAEFIEDYNRDRFEAFAIRIFLGDETVVTVFAIDKIRQEDSILKKDKIPVKKFKLTDVPITSLLSYCSAFNCTLNTGNYKLADMEVINK